MLNVYPNRIDQVHSIYEYDVQSRLRGRIPLPWPVWLLLAYLAGITIVGKGPTYLGYPPVYWGEIVLLATLLWVTVGIQPEIPAAIRCPGLSTAISLWMVVGAAMTVVSIPQWGLEAVRDAAMWYYAGFYFVGLGLTRYEAVSNRVWDILRYCWVLALFWGSANYLSDNRLSETGPRIPWRDVTLFFNARDEIGEHLSLGALLILCARYPDKRPLLRLLLSGMALLGLVLFAGSEGRAVRIGFIASVAAALILGLARGPQIMFARRMAKLVAVAMLVLIVMICLVPDFARIAKFDRFTEDNPQAEGTRDWRWIWWQRLIDEVMTRNPAFGIGFGQSLHVYHPLMAEEKGEWVVRSPHNYHMTVLARMGFVGLALWLLILFLGLGTLFGRVWRGRIGDMPYQPERREELTFWVVMLVFTMANSSFGVLMEGPVLGIWFWFALGFALGRSQRSGATEQSESNLFYWGRRGYLPELHESAVAP